MLQCKRNASRSWLENHMAVTESSPRLKNDVFLDICCPSRPLKRLTRSQISTSRFDHGRPSQSFLVSVMAVALDQERLRELREIDGFDTRADRIRFSFSIISWASSVWPKDDVKPHVRRTRLFLSS